MTVTLCYNAPMRNNRLRLTLEFIIVVTAVLLVYISNADNIQGSDAVFAVHEAASILAEGNTDLDEYIPQMKDDTHDYATRRVDAHLYSQYPLGTPLLALPVVWLVDLFAPSFRQVGVHDYLVANAPNAPLAEWLQLVSASAITAVSAGIVYLIARREIDGWGWSAAVAAVTFAFGTMAWSTASRALWQHGGSMLMLGLVLYLLLLAQEDDSAAEAQRKKDKWVILAGLPLAYAFVVRPTNALPIIVFTLYILWKHRRAAVPFFGMAGVVATLFVGYSWLVYGSILPPYYIPSSQFEDTNTFWEALAGHFISPGRGLFLFCPVLVFSAVGVWRKVREKAMTGLDAAVLVILALHLYTIANAPIWWAGYAYGPRFWTDMLPFLIYLMLPVLQPKEHKKPTFIPHPSSLLFLFLLFLSIFIHWRGATEKATWMWNALPTAENRDRVWAWSDLQMLRGITDYRADTNVDELLLTRDETHSQNAGKEVYTSVLWLMNVSAADQKWVLNVPAGIKVVGYMRPVFQQSYDDGYPSSVVTQAIPATHSIRLELWAELDVGERFGELPRMIEIAVYDDSEADQLIETRHLPLLIDGREAHDIFAGIDNRSTQIERVVLGYGWYDFETWEQWSWRWARTPARLHLYAAESGTIGLTLTFSELHDPAQANHKGTQGLIAVDGEVRQTAADQPALFVVDVAAGWNTVTVTAEAGNYELENEMRQLSFAITNMVVTDE